MNPRKTAIPSPPITPVSPTIIAQNESVMASGLAA